MIIPINQSELAKYIDYKLEDVSPIYVWAKNNVSLPSSYSIPGPFDISKSRYLIEPFQSMKNNKIREIVVCASIQSGKSLIYDISIPWILLTRPGPIQLSFPTQKLVQDHVNNRLYPLLQNIKKLKHLLPDSDKDYTNTGMKFPNCTLYLNGDSETAFQSKSIRYAILDEVHLWEHQERINQAIGRTSAFDRQGTSKILIVSQPGDINDSFWSKYTTGTCEEWNILCSGCGKYFYPVFREQREDGSFYGIIFDINDKTKKDDKYNFPELLKTIRYECKYCGYRHIDSRELKRKWNATGKYIQTNFNCDNNIKSYRWNSIPLDDWTNLVKEFLDAKTKSEQGIYEPLSNFFKQRIAEPSNSNTTNFDLKIKSEIYDVKSSWEESFIRFATIDVQKYNFYMVVMEWSRTGNSRQLFAGECKTNDDIQKLITLYQVDKKCIFVDVGNPEKNEDGSFEVYKYIDSNGYSGLKGDHHGDDKMGYDLLKNGKKYKSYVSMKHPIPNAKNNTHYFLFCPNICKDILKKLLNGTSKTHTMKILDSLEFKKHCNAETKLPIADKYGNIKWKWINRTGAPNHLFDCMVMQIVLALLHPEISLIED